MMGNEEKIGLGVVEDRKNNEEVEEGYEDKKKKNKNC